MANDILPCVVVERLPFGSSSFTGCVADEFERGTLTISCPDLNDKAMEVFKPGTWVSAIQYDSLGYPLCTFTSEEGHRLEAEAGEIAKKYTKGAA